MCPFPKDLVHAVQALFPEPLVVREPLGRLSKRPTLNRVQVLTPRLSKADNTGVQKQPQLLRDGGLGHAGPTHQLVDRSFAMTKGLEEVAARRLGEDLEDVVHTKGMPKGIYVCLYMCPTEARYWYREST